MEISSMTITIDDLPEGIFFHILSFLPTFDAIRASAVSRKWRNIWHSIPVLRFNIAPFWSSGYEDAGAEVCQLVAEFISQTLFLRTLPNPLRKFELKFPYCIDGRHRCYVDSWIRYASSNVIELELELHLNDLDYEEEAYYDDSRIWNFHFSDLINSSIQILKLGGCGVCSPKSAISITSIKSVTLDSCYIRAEEVSNMVSACVNLEYLSITCDLNLSLDNLKIVSPKLKKLILSSYMDDSTGENSVEICAPSLVSITFYSFFVGKYILRDISSLVTAHLYFCPRSCWEFACWSNLVISLTGIESLSTTNMWVWFEFEEMEEHLMHENDKEMKQQSQFEIDETEERIYGKVPIAEEVFSESLVFNNLKHLELETSFTKYDLLSLEYLFQICPRLEFLVLKRSPAIDGNLAEELKHKPITFNIPKLREVKMKDYRGTRSELYVVGLLKKYKVVLEKIVAFPARSIPPNPDEVYISPFVL